MEELKRILENLSQKEQMLLRNLKEHRQKEIDAIIDSSDLSIEWKNDVFKKVFTEWNNRSTEVLFILRNRLERETSTKKQNFDEIWMIAEALVSKEDQEREKLSLVVNEGGKREWKRICFLNSRYEEVEIACEKTYKGKIHRTGEEFTYRLKRETSLIEKDEQLQYIGACYQIERPIIFSPYSRRAVTLCLDGNKEAILRLEEEISDDCSCFCFEENGLSNLLVGYRLCRNIEMDVEKSNPERELYYDAAFAPYGAKNVYRYTFNDVKPGEFIAPVGDAADNLISASKDVEERTITIVSRDKIPKCSFRSVCFQRADKIMQYKNVFINLDPTRDLSILSRLYTEGDIERALYGLSFPEKGFFLKFDGIGDPKSGCEIMPYAEDDKYERVHRRRAIPYASPRALPCCRIEFSCTEKENEKFLTDFANLVLQFLESRYPEYRWKGVNFLDEE